MSAVKDCGNGVDRSDPGLAYGKFSYTRRRTRPDRPARTVGEGQGDGHVPVWAGVGAIVLGGILLLVPMKN